MDTSTTFKSIRYMVGGVAAFSRKWKSCALGAVMASAMALPTTALGWDYANVPMFWSAGVNPNVMLMIDDSGSMHEMLGNQRYQDYLDGSLTVNAAGATVAPIVVGSGADDWNDPWYWCSVYNNSTKRCTTTNGTLDNNASGVSQPSLFAFQTPHLQATDYAKSWNTATSTCSAPCIKLGSPVTFLLTAHGFIDGQKVVYSRSSGSSNIGLTNNGTYYVKLVDANSFRLSLTRGGAVVNSSGTSSGTTHVITGKKVNNSFNYLYQFTSGTNRGSSLSNKVYCDVSKAPGDYGFILSSGDTMLLDGDNAELYPLSLKVGVMVSKNSSGNSFDNCIRFKESIAAKSPPALGVNALGSEPAANYAYPDSTDVYSTLNGDFAMFLLNRHNRTNYTSINFETFPSVDPDDSVNDANDFRIIPNASRMETARQAARDIVWNNFRKMQIGLASFNGSNGQINQAIGTGADPVADRQKMIGDSNGTDFPFNRDDTAGVWQANGNTDGAIGLLRAENGTPLAATQTAINNYFKGTVSSGITTGPVKYRCQKNYAVIMTDGDSNDTYLNNNAQSGYDTDLMGASTNIGYGAGNDSGGQPWNDTSFGSQWAKQNIVTYTIGLGLENDLLNSTPLLNSISVPASDIGADSIANSIKLTAHGLTTGDPVNVGTCTGTDYTCMYYAVPVDANHFRIARSKLHANNCATTYSISATSCLAIPGSGARTVSTGPGKSFFAYTPEGLSQSMNEVFADISNLTASASAVSANSKQFGAENVVYQGTFNTEDWSGVLKAYGIAFDGTGKLVLTTKWTTTSTMDTPAKLAAAAGKMFTWKEGVSTGGAVALDAAGTGLLSLPAAQQAGIGGLNGLRWLQGNNIVSPPGFRAHSPYGLLGDIINADPLFVSALNNGYDIAGPGASLYKAFVTDNRPDKDSSGNDIPGTGRPPMLYVGANDGMLHVIDANTGAEKMTYIPFGSTRSATEPTKLFETTQDAYLGNNHRYFVDGATTAGDVNSGIGSQPWRTYLVGALGAGGKTVYAIDITDPTNFSTASIKWEYADTELGYTFGKPLIARLGDNNFYAIFGNGLDSASGKAGVYLVDLNNVTNVKKLTTSLAGPNNGMMTVQVALDSSRNVSAIYGGDIKGNIWKYAVSSAGVISAAQLLFTASSPTAPTQQSVTGGIRLGKHPLGYGTLVYFGTGKYFENVDGGYNSVSSVPHQDTFYAVLDKADGATVSRSSLVQQTFSISVVTGTGPNDGTIRTSSVNAVNYSSTGANPNKKGWYIELLNSTTAQGERVVSMPVLAGSRIIFVSIVPVVGDKCAATGSSWLNELNAIDGQELPDRVLDTNGDGVIDNNDALSSSLQLEGFASEPTIIKGTGVDTKIMGSTSVTKSIQAVRETPGIPTIPGGSGRMSWQQLQ